MSKYKKYIFFIVGLGVFGVMTVIFAPKSLAISTTFINPSSVTGTDSGNVLLALESTPAAQVPRIKLKWFKPIGNTSNMNLQLRNFCNMADPSEAAYAHAEFSMYSGGSWVLQPFTWAGVFGVGNYTNPGWIGNGCAGGPDLLIGGIPDSWFTCQPTCGAGNLYPGYKVLLIDVTLYNSAPSANNIRRFRAEDVSGVGGLISQAEIGSASASSAMPDPSAAFAILGNKNGSQLYSSISFEFSMCFNPTGTYYMHWRDADYNQYYGNQTYWQLIDLDAGNSTQNGPAAGSAAMGGSNQHAYSAVSLIQGHRYRWQWNNVNHLNILHIWMPFSEINSLPGVCTDRPASGSVTSANCQIVRGVATDPDWPAGGLRVHLRTDNPYPTKASLDAEIFTDAAGNWSWTIPSNSTYKSSATHSVWIDILGRDAGGNEVAWVNGSNTGAISFGPCQNASCYLIQYSVNGGALSANIGLNGTASVPVGSSLKVRYTWQNNAPAGGTTWTSGAPYSAGSYQAGTRVPAANGTQNAYLAAFPPPAGPNVSGGDFRFTPVPSSFSIAPGGTQAFDFDITPSVTGTYFIQPRMVREGNEWFGADCRMNIQVTNAAQISCSVSTGITAEGGPALIPQVTIIGAASNTVNITISSVVVTFTSGATSYTSSNLTGSGIPAIPPGGLGFTTPLSGLGAMPGVSLPNNNYSVSANVNGSNSTTATCPGATTVSGRQPFVHVTGGDVSSGAGFTSSNVAAKVNNCGSLPSPSTTFGGSPGSGNILTWNTATDTPTYRGAGVQFAAFARGMISRFISEKDFATNKTPNGAGLAFSNTLNTTAQGLSQRYGGYFYGTSGSAGPCIEDNYAKYLLPGTPNIPPATPAELSSYPSRSLDFYASKAVNGQVEVTGNVILNKSNTTFNGRLAMFVTGDVYISDQIILKSFLFNSPNDIPYFGLFVKGNVYVLSSIVSSGRIEGVYYIQPKVAANNTSFEPNTGVLVTCARWVGNVVNSTMEAMPKSDIAANCGNRIDFNGFVTAKAIWLLRSSGNAYTSGSTPAESFNSLPELYFVNDPPLRRSGNSYDSASSLPPLL